MEQKSRVIGENNYLITQMNAIRALKVQTKLIKLLGRGALALLDNEQDLKEKIASLIPMLMQNFDDEVANTLILSLFEEGVFYKKGEAVKVVDFEEHFIGKIPEMWQVVKFIFEVNFSLGESPKSSSPTTKKASKKKEN